MGKPSALPLLKLEKLVGGTEATQILTGVSLELSAGSTHALMGPNGSGKSTLAQTLMGSPVYSVKSGKIWFNGKDITNLGVPDRSKLGMFMVFQYPSEIPGVVLSSYLRMIYNLHHATNLTPAKFKPILQEKMAYLGIKADFASRYLNDNFSGGEKKRMEMLQMLIVEPKLAIIDELDSGLDIDALKFVAQAVNLLKNQTNLTVLLITHYARILNYIAADRVHIMTGGRLIKEGGPELANALEASGYEGLEQ